MSDEQYRILIVDDEPNFSRALARLFAGGEFTVETAGDGVEALEKCREATFHAALVDIMMPGMDGLELLAKLREQHPETVVLMMTAHGSIQSAVEAMKGAAHDYLTKPFRLEEVREKVRRACRFATLEIENLRLKGELRSRYQNLVGSSPRMQKICELVGRVSGGDVTVLIQGESGTGKEQVARAIHFGGPRAEQPFVPVDCGAITPTLIESELFGHVKGAFTGANRTTEGLLRAAGRGSIFLDEIGELPVNVQAKLLRALQEREVRPVGSTQAHPIDARVIAATNRDLEKAVADGSFRDDLFYRLNVVLIKVPPLRERVEDIPLLARFLLGRLGAEDHRVSPEALRVMSTYPWPGNIRELENALEHAMAMGTGKVIQARALPDKIQDAAPQAEVPSIGDGSLESYERQALITALERTGGNRRQAAAILRIGEATLYRKMKRYGLS